MQWISSSGGPLVLLPSSSAARWGGVDRAGGGRSDYEEACDIEGFTGVLRVQNTQVLVLNDEPLQTAFVSDESGTFLVRWMYASDEQQVVAALAGIHSKLGVPLETVDFCAEVDEFVLMDAAECGNERTAGRLKLRLAPAAYEVRTYLYKPCYEVGLVVHEFLTHGVS